MSAQSQPYLRGEQSLRSGQLDQAQLSFQEALKLNPNDVGAHANLGVVFMKKRQWEAALMELRKAQKLSPDTAGIRLNIGLAEFRRGHYSEAANEFDALPAKSNQSQFLLGLCSFLTDRYQQAHQVFSLLRESEANNLQFLYAFGIASDNSGFADDGKWAIGRLMAAGDNSAEIHLLIGKAHLAHDEDEQAADEFAKARQLNNNLPFLHYYLGILAKREKDFEKAKQEFLADSKLEPDLAFNYEELANIEVVEGSSSEAEKNFKQAERLEPRLVTAQFGLAKLYRQEGRLKDALQEIDKAAGVGTRSASLHYLRAQILQSLNRQAEAEKEFTASKKLRDADRDDLEEKVSGKRMREVAADQ